MKALKCHKHAFDILSKQFTTYKMLWEKFLIEFVTKTLDEILILIKIIFAIL